MATYQEIYEAKKKRGFSVIDISLSVEDPVHPMYKADVWVATPNVSVLREPIYGRASVYIDGNKPNKARPADEIRLYMGDIFFGRDGLKDIDTYDHMPIPLERGVRMEVESFARVASHYDHVATFDEYMTIQTHMNSRRGLPDPTRLDYNNYLDKVAKHIMDGKSFIGQYTTIRDVYKLRFPDSECVDEETANLDPRDIPSPF